MSFHESFYLSFMTKALNNFLFYFTFPQLIVSISQLICKLIKIFTVWQQYLKINFMKMPIKLNCFHPLKKILKHEVTNEHSQSQIEILNRMPFGKLSKISIQNPSSRN